MAPTFVKVRKNFHLCFYMKHIYKVLPSFLLILLLLTSPRSQCLHYVSAVKGQLVVLECRLRGTPPLQVMWYREDEQILDSDDFRILRKSEYVWNYTRMNIRQGKVSTSKNICEPCKLTCCTTNCVPHVLIQENSKYYNQ